MPYIKQEDRDALSGNRFYPRPPMTAGELNYLITKEFYRRVAATYEDQKCKENGDVY